MSYGKVEEAIVELNHIGVTNNRNFVLLNEEEKQSLIAWHHE